MFLFDIPEGAALTARFFLPRSCTTIRTRVVTWIWSEIFDEAAVFVTQLTMSHVCRHLER